MENLYGKYCYFLNGTRLYYGKIVGHNKSEYKVKLNKEIRYKQRLNTVAYVKRNDLLFNNEIQTLISDTCSQYLIAVLSNDEELIEDTVYMLSQLNKYFPKNDDILKCLKQYKGKTIFFID